MTHLLEQAIAKLNSLDSSEQDAMAALILEELSDEEWWQAAFAKSQDGLAKLAERARKDIQAGRVQDLGIDEL